MKLNSDQNAGTGQRVLWVASLCWLTILLTSLPIESRDRIQEPGKSVVLHCVRGKLVVVGDRPGSSITVQLRRADEVLEERVLGYDGDFLFGAVQPGRYVLTIQRQDAATVGRALDVKAYSTPKTIFLEIRLKDDFASIRETVTDGIQTGLKEKNEALTPVSSKARRAFQRAAAESEGGNFDKAIAFLQAAIREQPDYFEAYNNLGVQYRKLRQWEPAILAFRKALELRQDSARPYVNLAGTYWEMGQTQSAVENFESALKIEPDSFLVHMALGQLYFQKQDYVRSQESLEIATHLNPSEARQAFLLLAMIAIRHQELEHAREYLQVMDQYFPGDPEATKLRATVQGSHR